ncbi:unnamed protein product [Gongylonema pulchrum]|uniref:Secreted protein n=1 Tax=Gongylonema pulchrum TaxID=637853 RepID=A0A183E604_9BILA|nr:unnamed protein product [Gongylonema pulchrum]
MRCLMLITMKKIMIMYIPILITEKIMVMLARMIIWMTTMLSEQCIVCTVYEIYCDKLAVFVAWIVAYAFYRTNSSLLLQPFGRPFQFCFF